MNFGEAPKYEPGSLGESLAEVGLPVDPRRLIGRGYKFTGKHVQRSENDTDRDVVFIGTITALSFLEPHEICLTVSDTNVCDLHSCITINGGFRWQLKTTNGRGWVGELKLL